MCTANTCGEFAASPTDASHEITLLMWFTNLFAVFDFHSLPLLKDKIIVIVSSVPKCTNNASVNFLMHPFIAQAFFASLLDFHSCCFTQMKFSNGIASFHPVQFHRYSKHTVTIEKVYVE